MTESQIQGTILDYLAARGILAFRQNSGAAVSQYNGKTRMIRYGVKGMADVLAFPILDYGPHPLWLEIKTEKGRQSVFQASFEHQVREHMHTYAIVRSVDDVEALLKRICA